MIVVVDGNPKRPSALSVALAVFEKIGDVFFFTRTFAKLHFVDVHPEVVLVASVGRVENTVLPETHGLDVVEAGAAGGVTPDSMAPIINSPFVNRCERHSAPPL
jgi:hypothetical protein